MENTSSSDSNWMKEMKIEGYTDEDIYSIDRGLLEADYGIVYCGSPWRRGIIHWFETVIIWIKIIFYTLIDKSFRKKYWGKNAY